MGGTKAVLILCAAKTTLLFAKGTVLFIDHLADSVVPVHEKFLAPRMYI